MSRKCNFDNDILRRSVTVYCLINTTYKLKDSCTFEDEDYYETICQEFQNIAREKNRKSIRLSDVLFYLKSLELDSTSNSHLCRIYITMICEAFNIFEDEINKTFSFLF